jgi:glycosyltransferase involved in cell wall biosynthesis
MKVCIALDHRKRDITNTGKGHFAQRLMCALEARGVDLVTPEQDADIDLGIGRWQYAPKAKKKILRLGAAHIDSHSQYKEYNKRKLESLKMADGVIYQSWFSRRVCNQFIGRSDKPWVTIPNGAEIWRTASLFGSSNFIASTRDWIPQKNLKDILKAFVEAENPDARLWVAGITHDVGLGEAHPNITYLGLIDQEQLASLYAMCNVLINIVFADACPNNVVEALCSGCWILSANSGGTPELVKEGLNGNVLPLYRQSFDYRPIDLSKRIKIDRKPLVDAFRKTYPRHAVNDYVNIDTVADQYLAFFHKVLDA